MNICCNPVSFRSQFFISSLIYFVSSRFDPIRINGKFTYCRVVVGGRVVCLLPPLLLAWKRARLRYFLYFFDFVLNSFVANVCFFFCCSVLLHAHSDATICVLARFCVVHIRALLSSSVGLCVCERESYTPIATRTVSRLPAYTQRNEVK